MRVFVVIAAAGLLSGCVSMSNLSESVPTYTGEFVGNYYDLAECTKATQAKAVPMIRMDLIHDKKQREATVTWNHEFGTMTALVFKEVDANHARLAIYSATANSAALAKYTEQCAAPV